MKRILCTSRLAVAAAALWFGGCGDDGSGGPAPGGTVAPGMPTLATPGPLGTEPGVAPGSSVPGVDGTATPAGTVPGVGTGPAVPGDATAVAPTGTAPVGTTPEGTPQLDCSAIDPGPAPLRRLTRFEYNNTIADLLGDTTSPANSLPPELLGNGYGNDAGEQPVSSFLAEQYGVIADDIAVRAGVSSRFPCVATAAADTEATCARTVIETFGADAYRRPLETADIDELVALYDALRVNGTFQEAIEGLVSAILQSPDYLYRFEWGTPDAANPALLRPTGREMASRLSYLFWGTMPDDALEAAATSGELDTPEGVRMQAARLLDDPRARPVVRYFFEHFLPINTVTELARDPDQYPTFDNGIGALMREETQGFLEHEIFQGTGTWTSALTAPYVWVNEELANYYGIPDVTGSEFRAVTVDPATTKRMGLLTQGAILAGTTITNYTNPVRRGGFIIRELMCYDIQLPEDPDVLEEVAPPEPFIEGVSSEVGRETARMRYEEHRNIDNVCITCHAVLDPPGFALENFDAVGLWRDQENGVTIDATGDISVLGGAFNGPLELAENIAGTDAVYSCFASNWSEFAYGRKLEAESDPCLKQDLMNAFAATGYNIKELLLSLTQTDSFLYLPAPEQL